MAEAHTVVEGEERLPLAVCGKAVGVLKVALDTCTVYLVGGAQGVD